MPEFTARVSSIAGEVSERVYVSESEAALRRELESQDLLILDLKSRNAVAGDLGKLFRLRRRVSMHEFLIFNQEMSALIKAGLPIVEVLDILTERRKNETFKVALLDIRDRVHAGESLSEAFSAQGDLFPPLYSSSLASGERSGELPSVLTRFIAYTQTVLALKNKVVQALIYPIILFSLLFGLILLMVFFVIPRFESFLTGFNVDLPLLTKIVLNTSRFSIEYWWALLGGLVAAIVGLYAYKKTDQGKLAIDKFQMSLPLVGRVLKDYAQNRFTRTLATLQAGGIPLVNSLELSIKAVGSAQYEKALGNVADKVREGSSLHEALDETGLMSDISIQMIKVGESTGALVEMLNNASEFTDNEIENRLARIVTLIEPIMLIFMAVVVGVMLMAIYLPLITLYGKGVGGS